MSGRKYKLKYKFSSEAQPGDFTREQIGNDGAADALLLVSIIALDDGGVDIAFLAEDGRNNGAPMAHEDLFKVWTALAGLLAESETLGRRAQAIAGGALHAVNAWMNEDDTH